MSGTSGPAEDEDDEEPADEAFAALREDQKEFEEQRKEIEAMLAENDRNLAEARRAVAAAAKDRGWSGSVQQRQPRPTSTYMAKGKGKRKRRRTGWRPARRAKESFPRARTRDQGPKGPHRGATPTTWKAASSFSPLLRSAPRSPARRCHHLRAW